MNYQIVLAPELHIDPDAFLAAWNDAVDYRGIAVAERLDQPPAGYPIDPGTALIFLGGVATTIITDVVKDLISKLLERKFFHKEEQKPTVEIVVIQQGPGSQLLVVKGQER